MPSSNFLSRRWSLYLSLAITLGAISPAIGQLFDFAEPHSRHGLLYGWFMGWPAELAARVGLDARDHGVVLAGVFMLQYLMVFAAAAGLVLLVQENLPGRRRPGEQPPERERAFDAAAALYCQPDSQ